MPVIKLPKLKTDKVKADLKEALSKLAKGGFRKIFDHLDQLKIKKGVDKLGIEKFINQCAFLAAGSGAIIGLGGFSTILIGVPLDIANLITQQFRVTMAIAYYNTGSTSLDFNDFMRIVASSLRVDTGMAISKNVMEEVAEKLMVNIGSKTAERLMPVVGAAIGGTVNYLFIKRIGDNLLKKNPQQTIVIK
ncbi:hypothetical protein [Mucilaginibacter sp. KACC 22063]|uniref:hypothetical protein n=1 Tax=Mucilaginibacter sp. KACC 22063 TaxID=3025666 RepID=UPI002366E5A1|nr:hypothetical protein [Mucilaginibacter sp. KACC 22063]WDF56775.1 hypothetical protein PQ461_06875 [Mucilaginibacter sp. KACC 22063]